MKKRKAIPLVLFFLLVIAFLVVPVSAGLTATDCEMILSRTGTTSSNITITGPDIAEDGTITIFVGALDSDIWNGTFTNTNVVVDDTAVNATWTGVVDSGFLTLTSNGGNTTAGENVTVTFTGALGSAWIPDTGGSPWQAFLTATRTDTGETATFNFEIMTAYGPGSLTIDPGAKITETDGATSMVITITEAPILQYDSISIYVADLDQYVANGPFTNDNVAVSDTAVNATWSGSVQDGMLTLTSNGGDTDVSETVTVNITGAQGNAWKAGTNGEQTITLNVFRMDNYGSADFNFVIETIPPEGYALEIDFSATPTSGIPPLLVSFSDRSKGNPTEWSWDFGDGGTSTDRNPIHIYSQPGTYDVALTVWNKYTMGLVSKTNHITVINGAIIETDTSIPGLTITNCGGPQTVMVNTTILPAELHTGNTILEIHPLDSGLKTIKFFSKYWGGFTRNGDLITGKPDRVQLVSVEVAPTSGFSDSIGKISSFNYSIDLPSYPCNAQLSTTIWEGILPAYDAKLQKITSGNKPPAVPIGTAYMAKITKTNFPSGARATIHMSVNSGWNPSLSGGPGTVFIWRIADDERSGQILPTQCTDPDPVNNLVYCEADSPLGLSTFGISSLTGNNNPFQMIAFVAAKVINPGGAGSGTGTSTENSVAANDEPGSPTSEMMQGGGIVVPTPVVTAKPPALSQPAMSTNVGMFGWLLAIIQDYPIILVGVAGAIGAVAYFGWWKRRL